MKFQMMQDIIDTLSPDHSLYNKLYRVYQDYYDSFDNIETVYKAFKTEEGKEKVRRVIADYAENERQRVMAIFLKEEKSWLDIALGGSAPSPLARMVLKETE